MGAVKSRRVVQLVTFAPPSNTILSPELTVPTLESRDLPDALAALSRTIPQHQTKGGFTMRKSTLSMTKASRSRVALIEGDETAAILASTSP
jgi:hypothetical protein